MNIKIKQYLFGFGFPLIETALSITSAFALSYFLTISSMMILLLPIGGMWVYGRYLSRYYPLVLKYDIGAPIKQEVRVRGISEHEIESIDKLIESNKLVIINCPKDRHLRLGLRDYIYNRFGFVQSEDGETFEVKSDGLGKRSFLLSYRSKQTLQEAMSNLLNRGWEIEGPQGSESNLIDRVYTQTMTYDL